MIRALLFAGLLSASFAAIAADDYKVTQLEQDVRDLQRQVRALTQQIEAQRQQPVPTGSTGMPKPAPTTPESSVPAWVDAAKWQRLAPGMGELDVVGALGPPTSMRNEGNQRVLLYALEIGSSGFLGGSVTLRDRVVVAIQKPVLR